jgi:hypothetical protein
MNYEFRQEISSNPYWEIALASTVFGLMIDIVSVLPGQKTAQIR